MKTSSDSEKSGNPARQGRVGLAPATPSGADGRPFIVTKGPPLDFGPPSEESSVCTISFVNNVDALYDLAYKLLVTNPAGFWVDPAHGVVQSGKALVCTITQDGARSARERQSRPMNGPEIFLLKSAFIKPEWGFSMASEDLPKMWLTMESNPAYYGITDSRIDTIWYRPDVKHEYAPRNGVPPSVVITAYGASDRNGVVDRLQSENQKLRAQVEQLLKRPPVAFYLGPRANSSSGEPLAHGQLPQTINPAEPAPPYTPAEAQEDHGSG